jgi:hypothetical protein
LPPPCASSPWLQKVTQKQSSRSIETRTGHGFRSPWGLGSDNLFRSRSLWKSAKTARSKEIFIECDWPCVPAGSSPDRFWFLCRSYKEAQNDMRTLQIGSDVVSDVNWPFADGHCWLKPPINLNIGLFLFHAAWNLICLSLCAKGRIQWNSFAIDSIHSYSQRFVNKCIV